MTAAAASTSCGSRPAPPRPQSALGAPSHAAIPDARNFGIFACEGAGGAPLHRLPARRARRWGFLDQRWTPAKYGRHRRRARAARAKGVSASPLTHLRATGVVFCLTVATALRLPRRRATMTSASDAASLPVVDLTPWLGQGTAGGKGVGPSHEQTKAQRKAGGSSCAAQSLRDRWYSNALKPRLVLTLSQRASR